MTYPLCPKCNDENWSVSLNDGVKDMSLVNIALEANNPNWTEMLKSAPSYVVIFVYCNSCGYTLTAQVLKQNTE